MPEAAVGLPARRAERFALALLHVVALHGRHIGHVLLDAVGGRAAGAAARLAGAPRNAGEGAGEKQRERQDRRRQPDQLGNLVAEAVVHHVDRRRRAEHRDHRHQREVEADALDRRRVDHRAVDAVADALIVEHGHRQARQAPEQARAQTVRDALHQADVAQQVGQPPDAASHRPAGADHVLRLRGRVFALGEKRQRAVRFAGAGAEEQQQREEQRQHRQQQAAWRQVRHGVDEGLEERRKGDGRFGERVSQEHVVREHLRRQRGNHDGHEAHGHQQELEGEQTARRLDVGERTAEDRQHVARAQVRLDVQPVVVGGRLPRLGVHDAMSISPRT